MRYRLTILGSVTLALLAFVTPLAAKSGNNPAIAGDYEVVFRGAYEGVGIAKVNGAGKRIVFIRGDLADVKNGGSGQFQVINLPFSDDGRFSGAGTFNRGGGQKDDLTVTGRMEPSSTLIKKARIICTFTSTNGEAGRIMGSH
jgi:hypothetical protein